MRRGKSIAASYARFSSSGQRESSIQRQLKLAQDWCGKNDYRLDPKLSFVDKGISGWKGDNAKRGDLGKILAMQEAGLLNHVDVLLIENLDRFSRQTPRRAFKLFDQLLENGLPIQILDRSYPTLSVKLLEEEPRWLRVVLDDMERAYDESKRKSDLVLDGKKQAAEKASRKETVYTRQAPAWIASIGHPLDEPWAKKDLIQDRVKIIKEAIKRSLAGDGLEKISKSFNAGRQAKQWFDPRNMIRSYSTNRKKRDGSGESANAQHFSVGMLYRVLLNPAIIGELHTTSQEKHIRTIEGHYPSIISHEDFFALKAKLASRGNPKRPVRRTHTETNMFSGLLYCGYSGSTMHMNNSGPRTVNGEKIKRPSHYISSKAKVSNERDAISVRWSVPDLESSFLSFCSDLDWKKVAEKGTVQTSVAEKVAGTEVELERQKARLKKVALELVDEDGAVTKDIFENIKADCEKKCAQLEQELEVLYEELEKETSHKEIFTADVEGLKKIVIKKRTSKKLRMRLIAEIAKRVDRIELFGYGWLWTERTFNWSLKFCDKAWLDEYKDAHDGQPPTFNPKLFEMPKLRAWFGREHRFFVVHFTNGVKAVVNPAHPSDPSEFDFQIGIGSEWTIKSDFNIGTRHPQSYNESCISDTLGAHIDLGEKWRARGKVSRKGRKLKSKGQKLSNASM